MLIASQPPNAALSTRGLVNVGPALQEFAGAKAIRLATAAPTDTVLTLGTSVADGSALGVGFLSMKTGMGGTEREWVRFKRPDGSVNDSVLKIDQTGGPVNTYAIDIVGAPAGANGIRIRQFGNYDMAIGCGQFGSPATVAAENKGLLIAQNANAFDSSTLMRFAVGSPTAVAASIPVFGFEALTALNVGQPLMRWRVNGGDVARMESNGLLQLTGGGGLSTPSVSLGTVGLGVTASSFPLVINTGWALASGTPALQFNSTTVWGTDTERIAVFRNGSTPGTHDRFNLYANGEPEVLTNGAGVILRSPSGTRYRLTVTNAGTLSITAV
jgi:hypothetical protein